MKFTKAFIGVALIAPSMILAQKVDLKLDLEKGKKYTQNTKVENVLTRTMQGQTMESNQIQTSSLVVEMLEDNGKTDTYKIMYGAIDMSSSAMGQNQSFSSDTASLETVDPMSTVLAGISGKEFKAKITEKGMVEEVMDLEEMVKVASASLPGGPATAEIMSESLGDNGFTKNIELTTDIFPEKSVKVGDSWTKDQFTSTGLAIIAKTTYTLESIDDGTAVLGVKAKLETDPAGASTEMQGMAATQYFDGERTGTLSVDVATGWVTSGTIQDDIVGSITLAPNAQIPDGMTIPIETKNTITISN